jgi:opacity protein-like surface antigen
MKTINTIFIILGGLLAPSIIIAQTYGYSLTASYLNVDAGSNGLLNQLARETGEPAYGDDLEEAPGFSIEWRTLPTDGISFGLEYIYFSTEASVSGNAEPVDVIDLNNYFDTTIFQGGATTISEEYTAHSYLFNFAYDVAMGSRLNAYFAAGVGLSHISGEASISNPGVSGSVDDSDTVFAYQLKAGLRYALNEAWSVQGGLRYLDYEDFEFSYDGVRVTGEGDVTAFEFGLSYAY